MNFCSFKENFLFYDFALLKLELSLAIIVPNIVDRRSTHLARVGGANKKKRPAQLKLKLGMSLAIDCLVVLRFKKCKTDSIMVIFDYKNITNAYH